MGMPNQTHEAARQIIENAAEIHGALALAGRPDLVRKVIKIERKAACIIEMYRPKVDPVESCRQDVMNAIGYLGNAINRNLEQWTDIKEEEVINIIHLADSCVKRGYAWLDMAVNGEEQRRQEAYMKNFTNGDDDECA